MDLENSFWPTRQAIARAHAQIEDAKGSRNSGRARARAMLEIVLVLAIKVEASGGAACIDLLCRLRRLPTLKKGARPHLKLFRLLGLHYPPGTAARHCQLIEAAIREGWGRREASKKLRLLGPTRLLAAHGRSHLRRGGWRRRAS